MIRRTTVVTLIAAVGAMSAMAPLADAATKKKPAPIKQTYTVNDPTPNPVMEETFGSYCRGGVPGDPLQDGTGHNVKVSGPGTFDIALSGVTGDWALELRDAAGNTIAGDDQNPPDMEALFVPVKKAGTYSIWACNLSGGPSATVTLTYTYK